MGRKRLPSGTTKAERNAERAEVKNMPLRGPDELSIYASGDGSISAVWQQKDLSAGDHIAIGRPVTMDDMRAILGTDRRAKQLVACGWKLWDSGHGPLLVADIERIDPVTLRIDDREYTYDIDGKIRETSLALYSDDREEVKNGSKIASVVFFLNHEKALKANPPEENN